MVTCNESSSVIKIRDISALKYLDHQVGIDYMSEVRRKNCNLSWNHTCDRIYLTKKSGHLRSGFCKTGGLIQYLHQVIRTANKLYSEVEHKQYSAHL